MNRRRQGSLRARLGVALAGAVLLATTVAGCAAAAPELDADTAQALQNGVMSVSVAAAAGDFTTAQAELSAVRDSLASSADRLSASRTDRIQSAIDLVDADLAAAIRASTTPEDSDESDESEEPQEPEESEDSGELDGQPATDRPEDVKPDEVKPKDDKSDEVKPEEDKPGKDKENPGQCKKTDTCE